MRNFGTPVPEELAGRIFTSKHWTHSGTNSRLRARKDVTRIRYGLYRHGAPGDEETWDQYGLPEPSHGLTLHEMAAFQSVLPPSAYSHTTAGHLYRFPLPTRLQRDQELHIAVLLRTAYSRRRGVVTHRAKLYEDDVGIHHGLWVTAVERTWLDLAAVPDITLEDLVVVGDHCVKRIFQPGRGRTSPLTTVDQLRAARDRRGRFIGIGRAREALDLIRVGADSAPETRLRLALIRAGFPEPALQVPVTPDGRITYTADLAYEHLRIALQYDGAIHRFPAQQSRDAHRDLLFQQHGWLVVRANVEDLRSGFQRIINLLRPHFR